jgi:biotin operon repressor
MAIAKITKEQVLSFPEKLKTMTRSELGAELGISRQTIDRWIRELRKRGIEVPKGKRGNLLDN